jgi:type IV fimbrial biogenesis protein FimT
MPGTPAPSRRNFRRPLLRSRGFSLQELLVALAIGGTVTSGAVTLTDTVRNNAIVAAANTLVSHLNLARGIALARHANVVLCPSADRMQCAEPGNDYTWWQNGWLVYVDENDNGRPDNGEIVRTDGHDGSGNITIRSSRHRREVVYRPSGTSGGSTLTLAICGAHGASAARYVTVSNAGRPRISRTTTSEVRCP